MMHTAENKGEEDAMAVTSHLLVVDREGDNIVCSSRRRSDSSITAALAFSAFAAACGSFAYGCAAGYSSPVEDEIMSDLGLSTADFSLFGSLLTVGGLLGSLFSGKLTDCIGRRGTLGLSEMISSSGWILIAFSQGVWSLDLGRLLLGVGDGLVMYAIPVYLAEITPRNLRGGSALLVQLTICCGVSTMYFAGNVITWRILALIGILPCLVQLLCLFFIPESPRYLANKGREREFKLALLRLRGENVNISQEASDIKEYIQTLHQIPTVNFSDLFQRKYSYALTVVLGMMALAQFGGATGILFYASEIFESAGCSTKVGSTAMAIIQVPASVAGVVLMDRAGRRPLSMFSASGMCLGCILTALSFLLKEHQKLKEYSPYFALIGILGYSATCPVGIGGLPLLLMSEMLPINIKGLAGSLAMAINWSTSWMVSYAFNFMLDWSSSGAFLILAGVNALMVLFIAKLVPETKGRTLEEIQESVTRILN
ncbi:hypothetical protein Ancab_024116 [Ancistrocladus abbreviatus]